MSKINILRGIIHLVGLIIIIVQFVRLGGCGDNLRKKETIRTQTIGVIASMASLEIMIFVSNLLN